MSVTRWPRILAFYLLLGTVHAKSPTLITSPSHCITTADCPETSYCKWVYGETGRRCQVKKGENKRCVETSECMAPLFCKDTRKSRCTKPLRKGEKCPPFDVFACEKGLTCWWRTQTCLPKRTVGLAGSKCNEDRQCNASAGFRCNYSRKTCVKGKLPGTKCNSNQSNKCRGFCPGQGSRVGKVCVDPVPIGGKCYTDDQCAGSGYDQRERTVCNLSGWLIGTCVRERDLLKRIDEPCDLSADACDGRRSLVCAQDGARGARCHQGTHSGRGDGAIFCTPGHPLSSCFEDSLQAPRTCRRTTHRYNDGESNGMFACLLELTIVPRGGLCQDENTICEEGLKCLEPGGVVPLVSFFEDQDVTPVPQVCLEEVNLGDKCGDRFKFKCRRGLRCRNMRCVKGEEKEIKVATHAGRSQSCTKLPCMPGLVCRRKKCSPPTKVVGENEACTFFNGLFYRICRSGLQCRSRRGESGSRCRKPQNVGARCNNHKMCAGSLECAPSTAPLYHKRRCYDAGKALPLGARCNPKAGPKEARCGFDREDPLHRGIRSMRCLRQNGTKNFTCQVVYYLFERCSDAANRVCDPSSLKCSEFGVCLSSRT